MLMSTLIYAANVWAIRYPDKLGKCVVFPNYIVRLETAVLDIPWYVLQSVLHWIDEILEMNNTRYSRTPEINQYCRKRSQ